MITYDYDCDYVKPSPPAAMITGTSLLVDGGWTAK
jgi:hypothetical protein